MVEVKAEKDSGLNQAMGDLASLSPDHGERRPDWRHTKAFAVVQNALDTAKTALKHPATISLATVTAGVMLAQGTENEGMARLITSINDTIAASPGGHAVLNALQTWALGPHFVNTLPTEAGSIPLVNVARVVSSYATVGGEIGLAASGIREGILRNRQKVRIREGREPLTRAQVPRFLLVGPMELMDSIARSTLPKRERRDLFSKKTLVDVMIHTEPGVPQTLGRQIERHFDLSEQESETALSGWFSATENMKKTGIDRAQSGVFAAFSADNALYYGRRASTSFTDSVMTTLVSSLGSAEGGKTHEGQHFLIIAPKGSSYLAGAIEGIHLLGAQRPPELSQKLPYLNEFELRGDKIDVVTPEDVFFTKHVQPSLQDIPKDRVSIVLHGGIDTPMLKHFKDDLERRDPKETFGKKILVSIVSDEQLGDQSAEDMNHLPVTERRAKIKALYEQTDLIYIYGDTDLQTTTLAAGAYLLGASETKTTYILERPGAKQDKTAQPLKGVCIYDDLVEVAGLWMRKSDAFQTYKGAQSGERL